MVISIHLPPAGDRHGLNVPVRSDPLLAPEIEATARRISGRYANDKTMEWSRRIAEAQFDLNRVRSKRRLLITQFLVDPYFVPRHIRRLQVWGLHLTLGARFRVLRSEIDKVKEIFRAISPESEEKLATILRQKAPEFATLDPYERRALSRRKAAIRNFERPERLPSRSAHTKLSATGKCPSYLLAIIVL